MKSILFCRFQPPPLTIELSFDAGSNESDLTGTYFQGSGLKNENPFWLQQNGSHAIWYHSISHGSAVWIIGDLTNFGEFQGSIYINIDKNTTYPNAAPLSLTLEDIGMLDFSNQLQHCNTIHTINL